MAVAKLSSRQKGNLFLLSYRNFSLRCIGCCAVIGCVVSSFAQQPPGPLAQKGGYQLVFHDEFDALDLSPNGLGDHVWYEGVWFNQKHAPLSNISDSASQLSLNWQVNQGCDDTSITTLAHDKRHFRAWRYGYFEARAKWDVVPGAWPAIWLIPVQDATRVDLYNGVRESGEIDIFEGQGDQRHTLFATVHDWVNNHDSANKNNVVHLSGSTDLSQFHDYGLLWEPGRVTWYLDGKQTHSEPVPAIFDKQDYYLVLSMQEGAKWKSGDLTGVSDAVMNMTVDWVHVWQKTN